MDQRVEHAHLDAGGLIPKWQAPGPVGPGAWV